jgi:hypothetical protein
MPEHIRTAQEINEKLSELRKRLENAIKAAKQQQTVTSAAVAYSLTREIVALEWVLGRSSWEGNIKF